MVGSEFPPARLRELRLRLGDTQRSFCVRLTEATGRSIQASRIVKWEKGTSAPGPAYLPTLRELDKATPPYQITKLPPVGPIRQGISSAFLGGSRDDS